MIKNKGNQLNEYTVVFDNSSRSENYIEILTKILKR
jgi:hypothetical protein